MYNRGKLTKYRLPTFVNMSMRTGDCSHKDKQLSVPVPSGDNSDKINPSIPV